MMEPKRSLMEPLERARAAPIELVAHTIIMIGLLGAFWIVEKWAYTLWGGRERLLLGRVPLHSMFDVADAPVLIYFLIHGGAYLVVRAYRGLP